MKTNPQKDDLDIIINRFAKKVDSLNWQSIAYQKSAKAIAKVQLQTLIKDREDRARVDEHDWYKTNEVYQLNNQPLLPDTSVRVVKISDVEKRIAQLTQPKKETDV